MTMLLLTLSETKVSPAEGDWRN